MTRKEAIKIVKEFINGTCLHMVGREALETLIPELRESEDEKIRKEIICFIEYEEARGNIPDKWYQAKRPGVWISYLEKQKEQSKEELVFRLNGLMQDYIKEGKDEEEKEHRFKCYKLFWEALEDAELFEQKEQKPILEVFGFKVGDAVRLKDGDGRKHIIKSFEEVEGIHGPNFYHVEFEDNSARDGIYPGEEYPNGYYTQMEKIEEEQKPAECIKTEELPKHIKAEFESFRNLLKKKGIDYQPAETYWTDFARLFVSSAKKLQKPVEWSEEDKKLIDDVINSLCCYQNTLSDYQKEIVGEEIRKLKSLKPQPKQEWSEEDEDMLNSCISSIEEAKENRYAYKETDGDTSYDHEIAWLKSLRPSWKPSEEQMDRLFSIIAALRKAYCDDMADFLANLRTDLKKLGVKEEPEYYQHFDPDC